MSLVHARRRFGFTLIELTVALALATILLGMVIVRFSWGSPRQQAIAEARRLGNLIRTFRERAQFEEREYVLRIDSSGNRYEVLSVKDSSPNALQKAAVVREGVVSDRLKIRVLGQGHRDKGTPVVLYFGRHGVLAETSIHLSLLSGATVMVTPNPLTNEVVYEER